MKKVSLASLIVGIVLIVCSVILVICGFRSITHTYYIRHINGFMRVSYASSASANNVGLAVIMLGGCLFNGGILLLVLSAISGNCEGCHRKKGCSEEKNAEQSQIPVIPGPDAHKDDKESNTDTGSPI